MCPRSCQLSVGIKQLQYIADSANIPSYFASRIAPVCVEQQCQVCTFIREIKEYVVMQRVTTNDITSGKAKLPFTSRSAWLTIQAECQDLRRTHAHLKQGTRPSKILTDGLTCIAGKNTRRV